MSKFNNINSTSFETPSFPRMRESRETSIILLHTAHQLDPRVRGDNDYEVSKERYCFLLFSIFAHAALLLLFVNFTKPQANIYSAPSLPAYIYNAANKPIGKNRRQEKLFHDPKQSSSQLLPRSVGATAAAKHNKTHKRASISNAQKKKVLVEARSSTSSASKEQTSKNAAASQNKAGVHDALLKMLHTAIAAKQVYPESALALNQTGIVKIAFTLESTGQLSNIRIIKSSGFTDLDSAAISAVEAISPIEGMERYIQKKDDFSIAVAFQ